MVWLLKDSGHQLFDNCHGITSSCQQETGQDIRRPATLFAAHPLNANTTGNRLAAALVVAPADQVVKTTNRAAL